MATKTLLPDEPCAIHDLRFRVSDSLTTLERSSAVLLISVSRVCGQCKNPILEIGRGGWVAVWEQLGDNRRTLG
jgi:hypothetical protein